jgi:hypothetical protein
MATRGTSTLQNRAQVAASAKVCMREFFNRSNPSLELDYWYLHKPKPKHAHRLVMATSLRGVFSSPKIAAALR